MLKAARTGVDTACMAPKAPKLPALKPDRLTIWPVEDDQFGADVLYHGRGAYQRAADVQRALTTAGIAAAFRQETDGAWGVRLGPLDRDVMLAIVGDVVGAARKRPAARAGATPQRRPARAR